MFELRYLDSRSLIQIWAFGKVQSFDHTTEIDQNNRHALYCLTSIFSSSPKVVSKGSWGWVQDEGHASRLSPRRLGVFNGSIFIPCLFVPTMVKTLIALMSNQ
jgi:hypothetical protein